MNTYNQVAKALDEDQKAESESNEEKRRRYSDVSAKVKDKINKTKESIFKINGK